MEENTNSQTAARIIIVNAGNGRSLGFQALNKAKEGEIYQAQDILEEAKKALKVAQKSQFSLLFAEASGEDIEVGMLMIHAQDHLMTSMLAIELIQEIVSLYKERENQK